MIIYNKDNWANAMPFSSLSCSFVQISHAHKAERKHPSSGKKLLRNAAQVRFESINRLVNNGDDIQSLCFFEKSYE